MAVLVVVVAGLFAAACQGDNGSPWLFCTTNPCQPLALVQLPAPPALSDDASLAAACTLDDGQDGSTGILLWHTDWDPVSAQGLCVSEEEARDLGAAIPGGSP